MKTHRSHMLEKLKKGTIFDLLVVGGGATGCGVALDAASRGLTVALVEKNDLAEGTSGRSTKLLHGGVRYLESAVKHLDPVQYHLVRDALKERGVLLRLAPHLCHCLPLITPLYKWMEVPYILAGLKLYDLLAGSAGIGNSRLLGRSRALERFPMLHAKGLKAGVLYYDGQFNDARMSVSIALAASQHGATIANHLGVEGLNKENGKITGVVVKDGISGESWDIGARVVINATGPFADSVRRMDDAGSRPMLKASSGTHIVLDKRFAPPDTGLLIPKTEDGRVLFVLPWEGHALVGTTDEPAEVSEHPRPMEEEIDYLIHYICKYFDLQFSRSDIKSAWSGLRPLVSDPRKSDTAKLSRDHVLEESPAGLLTIAGGKWTTYRKMACDTVDHAVKKFNLRQVNGCRTDSIPLNGGADFHADGGVQLAEAYGIDPAIAEHLNRAYGDQARSVVEVGEEGLGGTLAEGHPYLEAEVLWAVRHEMACRAMDVLARRTPLALLDKAAAASAAGCTIDIMAKELNWDSDRCREEKQLVQERLTSAI
ncbi:MAG: FAD-dependent oxidoreductase [bacterium]|nr:FAD-dependent oxidoreductase [bacterium]